MSHDPIAFMSYVRSDDEHENGRLTMFCARLAGEVRMQTGAPFHIFQDRNDIGWGQQWKARIDDSLDAVTFLVPIITPGFFRSPACRAELERFVEREKQLGRGDLILPVYYVECPQLSDEALRDADPLAGLIAARQYGDWRELRFEPFTSPQVGKMLATLASHVVQALGRDPALQTKRSRGRSAPSGAGRGTPSEASKSGVSTRPATPVSAKSEPPTHIVDAFHRGDYPTITAALAAAKPGDRILVRPGLYREGIIIDKPIEIIGEGDLEEIVIEATGCDCVLFQTTMGRVANLTLRQTGGGEWYGIDIAQGRLDVEGCDITSRSLSCVAIYGGADPRLRRNRIHDSQQSGIVVYDHGQGLVEDNEISSTELSGVDIRAGGNPTLRRNRIHDGKQSGVLVHENGRGLLEENEIFSTALSGVAIATGGNPIFRRNRIRDSTENGVYVYDNGQGLLEENEIFGNIGTGIAIESGSNPALRRNHVHDNAMGGVGVDDNGQGLLEDNEIFGNAHAGVTTTNGGNPTLRRNRVGENGYVAIWVKERGGGVFEDNDLRGNTRGPWDIAPDCVDRVKRERNLEDDGRGSRPRSPFHPP